MMLNVTSRGPQTPQTDGALTGTHIHRYDEATPQDCSFIITELFVSAV